MWAEWEVPWRRDYLKVNPGVIRQCEGPGGTKGQTQRRKPQKAGSANASSDQKGMQGPRQTWLNQSCPEGSDSRTVGLGAVPLPPCTPRLPAHPGPGFCSAHVRQPRREV